MFRPTINEKGKLVALQKALAEALEKNNKIVTRIWEIDGELRRLNKNSSRTPILLNEKDQLKKKLNDMKLDHQIKTLQQQVEEIGKKFDKNFNVHKPLATYRRF